MTVTKGKRNYSFPTHSRSNSDVDSLAASSASASDTESNNEPLGRPFIPPIFKNAHPEELMILKKNSGKKKLRRYQNRCLLQTLAEEQEQENVFVVIMEPYKSPFTRLLQNKTALDLWNSFVEKSEEEQEAFIDAFTHKNSTKDQVQKEKIGPRMSPKIKRIFKIKKNLSVDQVKMLEDGLVAFFMKTPRGVFESAPPSSFERLLVCTIAQYHQLKPEVSMDNGTKKIIVQNYSMEDKWTPAEKLLADFVAYLRK